MQLVRRLARSLRLRHLIFLLLLCSGIIPLAISSFLLIRQNRELLETQEKSYLTRSAASLSRELSDYLESLKSQVRQLGGALLSLPGAADSSVRLREAWIGPLLQDFILGNSNLLALRVLDLQGAGPRYAPAELAPEPALALDTAFEQARSHRAPVFRFAVLPETNEPVAALAVPVADRRGDVQLILEVLARLRLMEAVFEREATGDIAVFLVDRDGRLLWSEGAAEGQRQALTSSGLLRDFARRPLSLTAEYSVGAGGRVQTVLAQVSPVEGSGWGVVVQKPAAVAFGEVRNMVMGTVLSSLILVLLALLFAVGAARWVGSPIQRLAQAAHEMAGGNFGRRVEERRLAFEIADLAVDFNRMSGYVENYVEQLRQAAKANRDLFISSIRAFAASIDAKDPYTRGHSERVALHSRTISRALGQSEETAQKVWIAALLHDIGKIGVDDKVLKKGGVLTGDEYQQMKAHPVIGAEILSPVEALKEMLPAVRWHHENWNGRGYPDGLRGEEIPLIARIVAVADCYDAITTNRPYQKAYAPRFAVETITKLTGTRFDAKVVTAFLRAFEAGEVAAESVEPKVEERQAALAPSGS